MFPFAPHGGYCDTDFTADGVKHQSLFILPLLVVAVVGGGGGGAGG